MDMEALFKMAMAGLRSIDGDLYNAETGEFIPATTESVQVANDTIKTLVDQAIEVGLVSFPSTEPVDIFGLATLDFKQEKVVALVEAVLPTLRNYVENTRFIDSGDAT